MWFTRISDLESYWEAGSRTDLAGDSGRYWSVQYFTTVNSISRTGHSTKAMARTSTRNFSTGRRLSTANSPAQWALTVTHLQRELIFATGFLVSVQTICNLLHQVSLRARSPMSCIPLSPQHRVAGETGWKITRLGDVTSGVKFFLMSRDSVCIRAIDEVWFGRNVAHENPGFLGGGTAQYTRVGALVWGGISMVDERTCTPSTTAV